MDAPGGGGRGAARQHPLWFNEGNVLHKALGGELDLVEDDVGRPALRVEDRGGVEGQLLVAPDEMVAAVAVQPRCVGAGDEEKEWVNWGESTDFERIV